MPDIGLVALDIDGKWIGGRYYLQHLIKSVASLPEAEQIGMTDVWWQQTADEDPFAEVRGLLKRRVIVRNPTGLAGRLRRRIHRVISKIPDSGDLFRNAHIGALFPVLPCNAPGIPFVFWLSDFQYLELPDLFGEKLTNWYAENNRKNVSEATLVVLSSQHAFRTLKSVFPEALSKSRVISFCSVPDHDWWRLDPATTAEIKGLGPFILFSNQFTHHKNHEIVFEAVRILRDRGTNVRIVCTGSTYGFRGNDYFAKLRHFIDTHRLDSHIEILGMLPRDEHVALMRRSIAMIQPSRFEGWSTAVEDAKTLGKTLLVSDIEVHREQLGHDYPLYIPVDDAEAWAEAMSDVWSTGTTGPHLENESRGLHKLKSTAIETGRSFVSVMREAMGSVKHDSL